MRTLSVSSILRDSVRIWRRDLWGLTILAAMLELPIVLGEIALHLSPGLEGFVDGSFVITRGVLLLIVYGALSHHFLAGLLERVVASERHGHPRPVLGTVLRDLPWFRLVAADLLLTALILLGLAAFVVPGLLVIAWFAPTLPIINLERRPVLASFRRSYQLVRGHTFRVGLVAVGAFLVPESIVGVIGEVTHTGNVVLDALAHAVPAVVLLPLAALPLVVMTFDLVALDPGGPPGTRHPETPAGQPAAEAG